LENERFLTPEQEKKIVKAIRKAEKQTSGEIRVHIGFEDTSDHIAKTVELFHALGMHNTEHRNGVLIHVGAKNHNFTILGDEGINEVVPPEFWEKVKKKVLRKFRKSQYVKGLKIGIEMTGNVLKEHFPFQDDDINELPDEISWT